MPHVPYPRWCHVPCPLFHAQMVHHPTFMTGPIPHVPCHMPPASAHAQCPTPYTHSGAHAHAQCPMPHSHSGAHVSCPMPMMVLISHIPCPIPILEPTSHAWCLWWCQGGCTCRAVMQSTEAAWRQRAHRTQCQLSAACPHIHLWPYFCSPSAWGYAVG